MPGPSAAVPASSPRAGGASRVTVMVLLLLCYLAASLVFQLWLGEETIYTHLGYIPLVLAGLWWGRRGAVVALVLAVIVLAFHVAGIAAARLASDLGRVFFFLLTGAVFGRVGERLAAGRAAQEKERALGEQLIHSARLAELGEMAAGVAHELNQPLTGIRTFARNAAFMLEEGAGPTEEVLDNLGRIVDQVDRAAKIIGQMRELSRKSEEAFAAIDIARCVEETLEFLGPELRRAGVILETRAQPGLPAVRGDRIRLQQVFLNLANNAVRAMEGSTVRRLRVETRRDEGPGDGVIVEVADTGVGFPPGQALKLFTPFYTTRDPGQGTGLGLSISLNIVKNHSGVLEAEGRPGEGAVFRVRLPAATA